MTPQANMIFFFGYDTLSTYYFHCNPLQGNYRVELLHREIPVVIIGNEFTEYNFLQTLYTLQELEQQFQCY